MSELKITFAATAIAVVTVFVLLGTLRMLGITFGPAYSGEDANLWTFATYALALVASVSVIRLFLRSIHNK